MRGEQKLSPESEKSLSKTVASEDKCLCSALQSRGVMVLQEVNSLTSQTPLTFNPPPGGLCHTLSADDFTLLTLPAIPGTGATSKILSAESTFPLPNPDLTSESQSIKPGNMTMGTSGKGQLKMGKLKQLSRLCSNTPGEALLQGRQESLGSGCEVCWLPGGGCWTKALVFSVAPKKVKTLPTYKADSGSMKFKGFYDYLINLQATPGQSTDDPWTSRQRRGVWYKMLSLNGNNRYGLSAGGNVALHILHPVLCQMAHQHLPPQIQDFIHDVPQPAVVLEHCHSEEAVAKQALTGPPLTYKGREVGQEGAPFLELPREESRDEEEPQTTFIGRPPHPLTLTLLSRKQITGCADDPHQQKGVVISEKHPQQELVPTLSQNHKVSRVEILQHVINYIWDLEVELNSESQVGTPGSRGLPAQAPLSTLNGEISALVAEAICAPADDHLVLLKRPQGPADPSPRGPEE
ncbi:hypothetical protein MC885_000089 [Smutsia gigantea]|nr:hypothetical protein MC885_000089 [Smutsia gigantea]